jgi:site-specific recombinase XerD
VLRYRLQLEARHLASSTINVCLAPVRRLAYEAADSGLLSPDLAASIRREKSVKNFGVRLGNWLTPSQGKALLGRPDTSSVRGKRDHAILALQLGCGLRRSELVQLTMEHLQQREEHWAIIDLIGKGVTCERFQFQNGWRRRSTCGRQLRRFRAEDCFGA